MSAPGNPAFSYTVPADFQWPDTAGYRHLKQAPLANQVFADMMRNAYPEHFHRVQASVWPGVALLFAHSSIADAFSNYWAGLGWDLKIATLLDEVVSADYMIAKALNSLRGHPPDRKQLMATRTDIMHGNYSETEAEYFFVLKKSIANLAVAPADLFGAFASWARQNSADADVVAIMKKLDDARHEHGFLASMSILERFLDLGYVSREPLLWFEQGIRHSSDSARHVRRLAKLASLVDVSNCHDYFRHERDPNVHARVARAFMDAQQVQSHAATTRVHAGL